MFGGKVDVTLYQGEGTGGALLASWPGVTLEAQGEYRAMQLTPAAAVTIGSVYTLRVQGTGGVTVNAYYSLSDTYAGGRFSQSAVYDAAFRTFVDVAPSASLYAGMAGVGINTTAPNEKLDVNGAILVRDIDTPTSTADRLYNQDGDLYWNGAQVTSGTALSVVIPPTPELQDLDGTLTDAQVPDNITITEADTLASVVARGATADAVTLGSLSATTATLAGGALTSDPTAYLKAVVPSELTMDQSQIEFIGGVTTSLAGGLRQTFTAGVTGNLVSIVVWTDLASIPFQIYGGTGTGGTLIYDGTATGSGNLFGDSTLTLNPPPAVQQGQVYTLHFPQTVSGEIRASNTNPYPDGALLEISGWDLYFRTYIGSDAQTLLMVDASGTTAGDVGLSGGTARLPEQNGTPTTTSERLYNVGNDLYWNGTQVTSGSALNVADVTVPNLEDLTGTLTDAQIPDNITITEADTLASVTARGSAAATATIADLNATTATLAGGSVTAGLTEFLTAGTAPVTSVDQSQTGVDIAYFLPGFTSEAGQSFTAGITGELTALDLSAGDAGQTFTVRVYNGAGYGGALLYSQTHTSIGTFGTYTLNTPVDVVAGSVYTLSVSNPSSELYINYNTGGGYAGGNGYLNGASGADMRFRTYVRQRDIYLTVDANGAAAGDVLFKDGTAQFPQGSAPGQTTDKLYNVGGNLMWNGSQLNGQGGGGGSEASITDGGNEVVLVSGNYTTIASKNFIAPADGSVLVMATGYVYLASGNYTNNIGDYAAIGIATAPGDVPLNTPARAAGSYITPYTTQHLIPMLSGQSQTFYVVGQNFGGPVHTATSTQITVLFIPAS